MKYKFILSTIALLFLTSCTEQIIKNDLTKENLKGKVKSTKETSYKAVEKFGETIKGNKSYSKKRTYNELGFIMETKDYDAYGKTLERSVYDYDEKGNLLEYKNYNSEGLTSKRTFKHDKKGNQIEENRYYPNGELWRKKTFKYDKKGNCIEEISYNSGELEEKKTYKYDKKGNQIEWNWYYPENGKLVFSFKMTFKYDKKGNLIEWNGNGFSISGKTTYKYKYDQKENWIEKIEYDDDVPQKIIEREIEYYD